MEDHSKQKWAAPLPYPRTRLYASESFRNDQKRNKQLGVLCHKTTCSDKTRVLNQHKPHKIVEMTAAFVVVEIIRHKQTQTMRSSTRMHSPKYIFPNESSHGRECRFGQAFLTRWASHVCCYIGYFYIFVLVLYCMFLMSGAETFMLGWVTKCLRPHASMQSWAAHFGRSEKSAAPLVRWDDSIDKFLLRYTTPTWGKETH